MSDVLTRLAEVIEARKSGDPEKSYVARLFQRGEDTVLKKIGEEATETILAAKGGKRDRIVAETADLWFHCLVMLSAHGIPPEEVLAELTRREKMSGLDEFAARKSRETEAEQPNAKGQKI
jgi:phosphoribosyl-ATP pyrophosphohydrolase